MANQDLNKSRVNDEPTIIQGGMGVAISGWKLANAVSKFGQLGVVSGTALDSVLLRRLQLGDEDASIRRALQAFSDSKMASSILQKYFIPKGTRNPLAPFAHTSMLAAELTRQHQELLVVANFIEVFLAKEGHRGLVGINYLEKIRPALLPSLYGAILAGVDYVLMGAGIPRYVPILLDRLREHQDVELKLDVAGATSEDNFVTRFSPSDFSITFLSQRLRRPKFLPIISSASLASTMLRKAEGTIEGFVVETPVAGGHNAPPRGKLQLNETGEPLYSDRDEINFETMRELKVPFWMAGSYGSSEGLKKAKREGASGIQVGTAFALSEESGLSASLKTKLIQKALKQELRIFTDPRASPTGFPFKVAELEGTLSEKSLYEARARKCDLGYLRQAYKKDDGTIGYRCPSEPVEAYQKKGGQIEDTENRKCLCNALLANVDLPQPTKDYTEMPLVTLGNDVHHLRRFLKADQFSYTAEDVLKSLLQP